MGRVLAAILLIALAPLLLALGLWVITRSGRPMLYHEQRLGRQGHLFTLWKFRTLSTDQGPTVAPEGDTRITVCGTWLRCWRLDELPQLYNVLVGDMSLVGPRPLSPVHAAHLSAAQREALQKVRPGITGPASLAFIGDDAALAEQPSPERAYLAFLLPAKVAIELEYLNNWHLTDDVRLIWQTLTTIWSLHGHRRSCGNARDLLDDNKWPPDRE